MDSQLVAATWPQILTTHRGWLSAVIFARVRDHEAVEEILQETALAATVATKRGVSPTEEVGLKRWLYRVAIRQATLYRRKLGRNDKKTNGYVTYVGRNRVSDAAEGRAGSCESNPLSNLLATENSVLVQQAMQRLSNADCEILFLKYTEDWSCGEMATRLGVSLTAVKSRLLRARGNLRKELVRINHPWDEK